MSPRGALAITYICMWMHMWFGSRVLLFPTASDVSNGFQSHRPAFIVSCDDVWTHSTGRCQAMVPEQNLQLPGPSWSNMLGMTYRWRFHAGPALIEPVVSYRAVFAVVDFQGGAWAVKFLQKLGTSEVSSVTVLCGLRLGCLPLGLTCARTICRHKRI